MTVGYREKTSTILSRFSNISIHNVWAIRRSIGMVSQGQSRSTVDIARKVEPNTLLFLSIVNSQ